MDLKEKKIKLNDTDLLLLFGYNDDFLKMLEKEYNSVITIRGSSIIIKGNSSEVRTIEKVFDELLYTFKRKGTLNPVDISEAIQHSEPVESLMNGEKLNDSNAVYWGVKDLVRARNPKQADYFNKVRNNDVVFAIGPAGTGKTFLAVAMALNALKNNEIEKIILSRPAVEAGESLGFLPGDLKEKIDPYLRPLTDALFYMLTPEKTKSLMDKNIIEIIPLAYMRGRTLNNSFIILDESQNATITQMKMFLTRLGINSKAIITGDITQIDLSNKSNCGLINAQKILKKINGIEFVYFDKRDVVRHRLVADIIDAYEKYNGGEDKKHTKSK